MAPPPLSPRQAQARLDALQARDEARLMRSCGWAMLGLLGPGVAAVVSGKGGLLVLALCLSGGLLWREKRRWDVAVPRERRRIARALWPWISGQADPAGAARGVVMDEGLAEELRQAARDWERGERGEAA